MVLLIALLVAGAVGWGARRGLRPAVVALGWFRSARIRATAHMQRSPATFVYLFVVTVTAWVLATSGPHLEEQILQSHSSNLAALVQSPVKGLLQSAFWVEGVEMLIVAWVLGLVLAPVERVIGTARWVFVFVVGHVGATLVSAVGLWLAIRTGLRAPGLRHMIDVGVSYGFLAIAGVGALALPGRWRRPAIGVVLGTLVAVFALMRDVTSFGHVIAFCIGLACGLVSETGGTRVATAE